MTFEEFLEWVDEDTRAEWVDGRVELMTPVNAQHQHIVFFLVKVLGIYIDERGLGQLSGDPAGFRNAGTSSFRMPDLFFVANANRDRIFPHYVDGAPDLTVEVLSPSDKKRDTVVKFEEYARGGVQEYWIIDPDEQDARFYTLDSRHRFVERSPTEEGVYRSHVVAGFFLRLAWLWRPHSPLTALRELGVN